MTGLLFGQSAKVREKAADYAVSVPLSSDVTLAAESLARSLPTGGSGVLFAEDHLIIEVAFFGPPNRRPFKFAPEDFVLLLDKSKVPLTPDSAGAVAMSMRDSAFNANRPSMQVSGGINNAGVILGRRNPTTGAPDIDGRSRGPSAPRVPGAPDRSGTSQEPLDIPQIVAQQALAACDCKLPAGGLLYFPYRGKLKSIRKMVLRYAPGGDGGIDLTLLP